VNGFDSKSVSSIVVLLKHDSYTFEKVATILDKMLKPATDQMPVQFARQLLALRADVELMAKIDDLRSKANSGSITQAEDAEYKEFVEAVDILSLLQARARSIIASHESR
jgi:hypothetical protein